MPLITPASSIATIAQGPELPWGGDKELAAEYAEDPKAFLLERCKLAMDNSEYTRDWVVCATYYLPDFIIMPNGKPWYRSEKSHDEALWQGKVGLIIGMGPLAFKDEGALKFGGQKFEVGDWVQWDIHDARQFTINRVHCRYLKDVQIIARVKDPGMVY